MADPRQALLVDVVAFEVDGRRFGIPAAQVIEVLPVAELLEVPEAGPFVEGLLDVRGELLPVLSVRATLDHPPRPLGLDEHLLRVRIGASGDVLLRVDRALDLVGVDPQRLVGQAGVGSGPPGRVAVDGLLVVDDPALFLGRGGLAAVARLRAEVEDPSRR